MNFKFFNIISNVFNINFYLIYIIFDIKIITILIEYHIFLLGVYVCENCIE